MLVSSLISDFNLKQHTQTTLNSTSLAAIYHQLTSQLCIFKLNWPSYTSLAQNVVYRDILYCMSHYMFACQALAHDVSLYATLALVH